MKLFKAPIHEKIQFSWPFLINGWNPWGEGFPYFSSELLPWISKVEAAEAGEKISEPGETRSWPSVEINWVVATHFFYFHPYFGEDSHFDSYFSDGLVQPLTSKWLAFSIGL